MTTVVEQQRADQHFQVLLDEDGLLGPDGQAIPVHTNIAAAPNQNQATAVVDTGFSFPQLPKYVIFISGIRLRHVLIIERDRSAADAIYSRFRGAELKNIQTIGQVWIVPCSQEVNVTFKFAGQRYPIHPLDATL